METDALSTPAQENGAKIEESSSDPPGEEINGKEDVTKTPRVTRTTRSRSRTPQKAKDKKNETNLKSVREESKVLTLSPKSADKSLNGLGDKKRESSENKDGKKDEDKEEKSKKQENLKDLKKVEEKEDKSKKQDNSKNLRSSDTKDSKKVEEKDEKSKKQDVSKNLKSPETKDSKKVEEKEEKPKKQDKDVKKEGKAEGPKKKDSLNSDVSNKETVEPEENKTEASPKKYSKREKSKQDEKKSGPKDINTLDSEISLKINDVPKAAEGEAVEMDPLILASDEPDPELQFDENSDLESGKGSPIQLRCKTRRSHTRNIPTPKTPKSTDSESEKNSVAPTPTPENLNDTNDSLNIGDISTRAEAGSSDSSRLEYIARNSSVAFEDSSYLNSSRERSLGETLRCLSARKTIRPINDAYRQRAFRNNQNKSDLNLPYPEEDSVDRITGIKRKRSSTPEDRKKFKSDSAGFVSYLSSPISNLKNRFITDARSSTPKLTGYKNSREDIHEDVCYTEIVSETADKKNWCAIM